MRSLISGQFDPQDCLHRLDVMHYPDTREWLLTNGLGSFASGTVCDARTRTYHGWLMAALDPPSQRTLLLSHLDAILEVEGEQIFLGTNFWLNGSTSPLGYQVLSQFALEPVPTWTWGQGPWQLTRQLIMPYGLGGDRPQTLDDWIQSQTPEPPQTSHRLLVRYRYQGDQSAVLQLRPLIGDRNFHHQQQADPDLRFSQLVGPQQVFFQAIRPQTIGTPWQLRWTRGHYQSEGLWYWNYHYPEETQRGLADYEDLYNPGILTIDLAPGDEIVLEARVGWFDPGQGALQVQDFEQAIAAEQERLAQSFAHVQRPDSPQPGALVDQLLRASDQFVVYRASINGPTVIAGYPWFNDWGRDTLIALPGLALATRRFTLARGLLETFGQYCQNGLIPNTFPDQGSQPYYNSLDAALWWIEVLGLYLEATQDWEFLPQQYGVVQKIYKAFISGTLYNIRVDASDGLLTWDAPDVALTWMDAIVDGKPVTPRRGKPVEINALWYSALCWASRWADQLGQMSTDFDPAKLTNQARRYQQHAQQVQESLVKFWNPEQGYLYDTIEPNDWPVSMIRPNAVLALSLYHCGFSAEQAQRVLQVARDRLLTPYGLRSLDPAHAHYQGYYAGNSRHRDSAYHQGTVWNWLLGPFLRSWQRWYGTPLDFDWQPLTLHLYQQACLGSISEIFDGTAPYFPQGAIAQAWSVAELIRFWLEK